MDRPRKHPGIFSAVLWILSSCSLLAAQTADPGLAIRKDYATEWARNLSLAGVVGAAALILYVIIFKRRQLTALPSQWMLFVGICIMPLPVMVLSTAVGLEQAKDITFCQQCHVMRPFIADMKSPASDRLAAVHFKNRYIQRDHCYVCHTDYGLFGTVEAKLSGMGHIWRETAGTYTLPVRIARPYRFIICLDCHANSEKYEIVSEHKNLLPKIVRGEETCTSCHASSHLPPAERGT